MRIGELDQHCGNCKILQYCAEPFDELCVCTREALEDMEEEEYIRQAEEIRRRWTKIKRPNISNMAMCNRICREEERKNAAGKKNTARCGKGIRCNRGNHEPQGRAQGAGGVRHEDSRS